MIFTQNSEWTAMKSDWTELFFFTLLHSPQNRENRGKECRKRSYRLGCVWGYIFWLHRTGRWGGSKGRHRTTNRAWRTQTDMLRYWVTAVMWQMRQKHSARCWRISTQRQWRQIYCAMVGWRFFKSAWKVLMLIHSLNSRAACECSLSTWAQV